MKQTRRKELKTNELSVYLQQIYDAVRRNSSYLIGGAAVIVLVLVVGLWVQRNRQSTMLDAWATYTQLSVGDAAQDVTLLDRVRVLVAEQGDEKDLGPLAFELLGRLSYNRALALAGDEGRDQRVGLLKEARTAYEQVLAKSDERPAQAAGARMALASVEESLILIGDGDRQKVRQLYQQVIDGPCNPYQTSAAELLKNLDRRLVPLQIVAPPPATEPAATAPATLPAPPPFPETGPAPEFGPAVPEGESDATPQAAPEDESDAPPEDESDAAPEDEPEPAPATTPAP